MSDNDKIRALAELIGMFGGRPHHLAKFLVDNGAVTDSFLGRIDCSRGDGPVDFSSIAEMEAHYASMLGVGQRAAGVDLEAKLARLVEDERYEDAARLRDYIRKRMDRH